VCALSTLALAGLLVAAGAQEDVHRALQLSVVELESGEIVPAESAPADGSAQAISGMQFLVSVEHSRIPPFAPLGTETTISYVYAPNLREGGLYKANYPRIRSAAEDLFMEKAASAGAPLPEELRRYFEERRDPAPTRTIIRWRPAPLGFIVNGAMIACAVVSLASALLAARAGIDLARARGAKGAEKLSARS